ncbi:MAG TPA: tetratricopeptide repeat protein [Terracidiphilus sp.]|jgi:tetratricopeptide (TPR) repeat protein|nr:tetratricopeptide repeat protein [Terracidiphilus sp.]
MSRVRSILALAAVILSIACTTPAQTPGPAQPANAQPTAGDEVNNGVLAYRAARYDEAIAHFRAALQLNPEQPFVRAYLATALAQNIVPGLDTPDNIKLADESIALFKDYLVDHPHDVNSMKQIAGIAYSINKLDEARDWQMKVLAEDPRDAEAAYTIGVIDWQQAHQNALRALQAAGFNDDGEGNISAPAQFFVTVKAQNADLVDEALHYLGLAVQLRPNYDDAMAYLNLVYRRKADLDHDDPDARKDDVATARAWASKAMETRKANEVKAHSGPGSTQN